MHLSHAQTLLQPCEAPQKVACLAWAPNNAKLAAATADRVVHLFDERGDKRDKFKTKAADPAAPPGGYLVRGLAFSPDSARLAVAQSDSIVFVYRLGADWADKKSICNKLPQPAPVTALAWPPDRPNEVVFGLADGRIRLGALKANKTYALAGHPDGSYVTSLAASSGGGGGALLAGHADGSVWRLGFPDAEPGAGQQQQGGLTHAKLLTHTCAPVALAWGGDAICAAGGDCRVAFYDAAGRHLQAYDFGSDAGARGFACAAFNPAGQALVLGAVDRLYVFCLGSSGCWEHVAVKQVDNFGPTTSLAWMPDGSRLAVGGLTGCLDVYDACLRRVRHASGAFEFTFISSSSVVVTNLASGARRVLSSVFGYELSRVNVYQGRFVVCHTPGTLLLGNLDSCALSEVPWSGDGGERFFFQHDQLCLVLHGGQLSVVEYGCSEPLALARTEHVSPYLLSLSAGPRRPGAAAAAPDGGGDAAPTAAAAAPAGAARRLAYLLDAQTVRVLDLPPAGGGPGPGAGGGGTVTLGHDARIDWLELNQRGSHLLFRDKRRHLHLLDLASQQRHSLLAWCSFVQWVPGSDVVVAQGRGTLAVWYSLASPDRAVLVPIRGDVEAVERRGGQTEVLVSDGLTTSAYALDEALVAFGAALDEQDLQHALATLEPLPLSPETRAQWAQLGALALQHEALAVAERCYAALGDAAKARFLHKLVKACTRATPLAEQLPGQPPAPLPTHVRAQLALLAQQWPVAEALLLAQGRVDEAIDAYKQAHRWDDAVRVADGARHPDADALRASHLAWLLGSGQEGRAAALKEREGDLLAAVSLYLKGGLPGRAAQVVIAHGGSFDAGLLDTIEAALAKAGLQEVRGDLAQHRGRHADALQAYSAAHAFRKAVELARSVAPASVIALEEAWGDWLAGQQQLDAATNHYIEAGCTLKAVEAAIADRQASKAAGLAEFLPPGQAAACYTRIAALHEEAGSREEAERCLLAAGSPLEAADMWLRAGSWDAAQRVARGYLPPPQLQAFYARRATACAAAGQWGDAERAFVAGGDVAGAVAMWTAARQWLPLLRLVGAHAREQLPATHLAVAQALQADGAWREAERHYAAAGQWGPAVAMYQGAGQWEDALRVARALGGPAGAKQVAYAWAVSLPEDEAAALLRRLGLGDGAVDAAVEAGVFGHAFSLAQLAAPGKLPEVHLRYAMLLEDSGRFDEAEGEFVAAGKPREAIDMHLHCRDWASASRVAAAHEPTALPDVLSAQATAAAEAGERDAAERLFLAAKRPEAALAMYRAAADWHAALRVAQAYVPGKLQEVHLEMAAALAPGGGGANGGGEALARARALEAGGDTARAIDAYLAVGPADTGDGDGDALQQCWEQAATLAMRHQRHRLPEVVAAVAERLVGVGRAAAAAELQAGVGDVQGAVATLCAGGLFDRARALAGGDAQLLAAVEARHTQHLVAGGDAEELAARGNAAAAVDMCAAQGNWRRAHELAARAGPELAAECAARHAALLQRQHDCAAAAAVLAQYGTAPAPERFPLYREVVLEVLSASQQARQPDAELHARQLLLQLTQQLEGSPQARQQDAADFTRLLWAAHLTAAARQAANAGLLELAARQLTALLRYTGIVPADRAFYEAGMAWRAAGRPSMAFVVLNRYLDVADAQDDPAAPRSTGGLESADWEGTDVPLDVHLPEQPYASEAAREEARNYVLELSMDARVEQALGTRPCEACGADGYEAGLACHACGRAWESCLVSGYPVPPGERLVPPGARGGLGAARRADWNAWVGALHTHPLTGAPAAAMY